MLTRDSSRVDFTGRAFSLPAGTRLATHTAWGHTLGVPELDLFDAATAYLDDTELCQALRKQGFNLHAARVSAASELIGIFYRGPEVDYPRYDQATVETVGTTLVPPQFVEEFVEEVGSLQGFRDDWKLYSDGTWGALSLRGFYPEDPGSDMKPSEMPRKWKEEHPEDLARTCEWTSLVGECPTLVSWVQSVPWWGSVERVRLLQMSGNNGKGGSLKRHTDIGDKNGGTRDGMITRFHVPILTDPRIELHAWELDGSKTSTHLAPFQVWYLDARKPHAVTNPTGVDRIHLVVDVVASEEVRNQISAGLAQPT